MTDLEKVANGKFLISEESIKPLRFFTRKYRGKILSTDKKKLEIGLDILRVCHYIFNNKELLNVIKVYREAEKAAREHSIFFRIPFTSSLSFVKLIDSLEDFYQININAGAGAGDKRVLLFAKLKTQIIKGLEFLERRTKIIPLKSKIVVDPQRALRNQKRGPMPPVTKTRVVRSIWKPYKKIEEETSKKKTIDFEFCDGQFHRELRTFERSLRKEPYKLIRRMKRENEYE